MKLSRRGMLKGGLVAGVVSGAMAAPAAASAAEWQWRHGHGSVLLFDPDLAEGRAFADSAQAWNRDVMAIEGDRVRFARMVFEGRPAIVRGVSQQADAVLVQDVAEEMGYERTALTVEGDALTWTIQPRIRPNR